MEFNTSKCQVLHITRLKHPKNTQYSLHGQVLEATDTAKYLGVSITKDLSWSDHISSITAKANRTLGFVKRNVRTNNEKVKELAYKTFACPQVEHASPVWSPIQSNTINKVEMIQRRAARWVENQFSSYESVTYMLRELGWRSMEDLRIDARLLMFYKIVHGLFAFQLPAYFDKPLRYTRHMHPFSFRQIHTAASEFPIFLLSCISSSMEKTPL